MIEGGSISEVVSCEWRVIRVPFYFELVWAIAVCAICAIP